VELETTILIEQKITKQKREEPLHIGNFGPPLHKIAQNANEPVQKLSRGKRIPKTLKWGKRHGERKKG
jgi:hypothetical protein